MLSCSLELEASYINLKAAICSDRMAVEKQKEDKTAVIAPLQREASKITLLSDKLMSYSDAERGAKDKGQGLIKTIEIARKLREWDDFNGACGKKYWIGDIPGIPNHREYKIDYETGEITAVTTREFYELPIQQRIMIERGESTHYPLALEVMEKSRVERFKVTQQVDSALAALSDEPVV